MGGNTAYRNYISELNKLYETGDATEHTHRPALKTLIEAVGDKLKVINEPKRIKCGAPDLRIEHGEIPIGMIETKDIGVNLDQEERSEQLKRYREALPNLILTDYLEFRWYVEGEHRETAKLATLDHHGKIHWSQDGIQELSDLFGQFLAQEVATIGRPKDLAQKMAKLAHMIRRSIEEIFNREEERGNLHGQLEAFRETLIPDLKEDQFADMYAQTIAYGLFAAWVPFPDNERFTREKAAWNLPKTNPFLRKLFNEIAGVGLDERVAWVVDDLAYLLYRADKVEVLRDFGTASKQEDPVVHFYETFLAAYDPKMRKSRGVYYTPEPVVSYIVRSVDYLLKEKFDKPLGLADPNVMILDPACGTGTFLYFVIKHIYETWEKKGQRGGWNDYVKSHLLPRIFGFELLMAPYTIAHMKLGMLLQDLGYDFSGDQRLGIYMSNTLEEPVHPTREMSFVKYITDEADAAEAVKRENPIMVVVGNPPYSGISANMGKWIIGLLKGRLPDGSQVPSYYEVNGKPLKEKKVWLQDDYVKFLRWGQWRIERTGKGILAMITNHGYLDNPTFRGMRQSLMKAFTEIYELNLHGNSKKKECTPEGGKDENVFDIQQGVAIGMCVKESGNREIAKVNHEDVWGLRKGKENWLAEKNIRNTEWKKLSPNSPYYFFVPRDESVRNEYDACLGITDIMQTNVTGIVTARDKFVIDHKQHPLMERIRIFLNTSLSDQDVKDKLQLSENYAWRVSKARKELRNEVQENNIESFLKPILYRPFDQRLIYYHPSVVWRIRPEVMRHMLDGKNIALITARSNKSQEADHFFCCTTVMETKCGESTTQSALFPLYLYPPPEAEQEGLKFPEEPIWPTGKDGHIPNLSKKFITAMEGKLRMKFMSDGKGELEKTFGPEDVLHYMYAIFHSPTYRSRYAEFLKIDFPRVPLTSDKKLFRRLCGLGEELVGLHLMESPYLENLITKFDAKGSGMVEEVRYVNDGKVGRVYINKNQYFDGINREVWEFHIGGYQVLDKWLKYRKGGPLDWNDQQHYQKIVVALSETIRLMAEIDTAIPNWPIV